MIDPYPEGFEADETLRSLFVRELILQQTAGEVECSPETDGTSPEIPRHLVRYWHDPSDLPDDVRECLDSWSRLADHGFSFHLFDDESAAVYIAANYGDLESRAFGRCDHPAMRCDYLRLCFVLAEGGLYVDADDVLLGDEWKSLFRDGRLKVQPLCYDIDAGAMATADDIWRTDLPPGTRVFYVNNDPIAAPANHPVIRRALEAATLKLLDENRFREIQSTTGPGNLTAALAAHARYLQRRGMASDFEILRNWDSIAEMKWNLCYRNDARNWRNVFGC